MDGMFKMWKPSGATGASSKNAQTRIPAALMYSVLGILFNSNARAGTISVYVAPTLVYMNWIAPCADAGEFPSVGAAFAAYLAEKAVDPIGCSGAYQSPTFVTKSPYVRPPGTINGVPQYYRWDEYSPAFPDKSFGGVIMAVARCPLNSTLKGIQGGDDQILKCKLTIDTRDTDPKECPDGNPIYAPSGLKGQSELDYRSPSGDLSFQRTYRSDNGRFSSVATSPGFAAPGQTTQSSACIPGIYSISEDNGVKLISVTKSTCFPLYPDQYSNALQMTPNGRLVSFQLNGTVAKPVFGSNDVAEQKIESNGSVKWQVKTEDNYFENYDANGLLQSRTSIGGRTTSHIYSDASTPAERAPGPSFLMSQVDTFGRALSFTYGSLGTLTQMVDPNGNTYVYSYDGLNRLVQVQYPDALAMQYQWNELSLTGGADLPKALTGRSEVWTPSPGGASSTIRIGSYGYDATGRAISTEGAGGVNRFAVTDSGPYYVAVTDPLGTVRTRQFTTMNGTPYVTSSSQPSGAGCAAAQRAVQYDANGNVTQQDDFNGSRTCFAYDTTRNLETVRVEGLANTVNCASVTPTAATLPSGSRKFTTAWHPNYRIKTLIAEPNKQTTKIYNGQPDPFNGNQVASCVSAMYGASTVPTLPDGNPIAVLCKRVEQATTDANGSQGLTPTLASGASGNPTQRQWSYTYNQFGQVLTSTDPLGKQTQYSYFQDTSFTGADPSAVGHTMGDLQAVTNAAGHVTQYNSYDKAGNVLSMTSPTGLSSAFSYWPRGWLKAVKQCDDATCDVTSSTGGLLTTYDYWPNGLLKQVTQPDGSTLVYVYDEAHRLVSISDAAGNSVNYTLDNAGNRIGEQVKDASGSLTKSISRSYDALNRLQSVTGALQ